MLALLMVCCYVYRILLYFESYCILIDLYVIALSREKSVKGRMNQRQQPSMGHVGELLIEVPSLSPMVSNPPHTPKMRTQQHARR